MLRHVPHKEHSNVSASCVFVRFCWNNTDRLRIRLQATVFQSEDGHVSGGMMKVIAYYR
jgi:hypothetical protein